MTNRNALGQFTSSGGSKSGTVLRDKGWNKIRKSLLFPQKSVMVGVIKDETHDGADGASVADVATWNHFGTSNIPARPFISGTVDAQYKDIAAFIRRVGTGITQGKLSEDDGLALIGELVRNKILTGINEFFPPPNADSTIERKGSSKPLIDTGQLKGAIGYEVRTE